MDSKVKIGLVEQDADTVLALQQLVARLGDEISFTAANEAETQKKINETDPPDLILISLGLAEEQEGLRLGRQLRADYNLPLIYLVSPAEEAQLEQLHPSEFSGYLLKPLSETRLALAIKVALHQHRLQQGLEKTEQQLEREKIGRRQAEAALDQSERRFRAVWEVAADGMALSDVEGKVIIANPAYYQLYQLTPEQVIGQDFTVIFPREWRETAKQNYTKVFMAETLPPSFEASLTHLDGTELFVEAKATFLTEDQRRIAMLSVIRDITARKQAEEALKQANAQLKQRVEELSTLNFISRTLAAITDLQSALEVVAGTMTALFNAHGTVIGLLNTDQTTLTLIVHHSINRAFSDLIGLTMPLDSAPALAQIIQSPQTVLLSSDSLNAFPPFLKNIMQERSLQAGMIIPLRSRGEVIGIIGLSTDQAGRVFTTAEVTLAETLAGQVAGAIEVARLFYEERRQHRVAESLRQVTTIIQENFSEQQLLGAILEQLSPIIRHDSGGLLLQRHDRLILAGGLGLAATSTSQGNSIPLSGQAPAIRVFKNKQLLLINDGRTEPYWLNWPSGQRIGAWIGAPLTVENQVIGVLTISTHDVGSYTEEDAQILQTFANQAALVIHKSRLFEALRQSEAILNETQKIAKVGGWEFNFRTRQLTWTEEVYHLFELPLTYEPTLETSLNFCIPEHLPILRRALRRTIHRDEPFDLELQIVTAGGQRRWVRTLGKLHRDQGKPAHIYGTLQDVTERKQLEEHLLQAQKMEAVGQLAGGVAHHFNNMLTAITGYVALALESLPADHPIVADLRRVQQTAERAATLTRQLLTFTRRQITRPRLLNLNDLIDQMQFMLRQFIHETIEFKLALAPDLKPVKMDAGQFEQLLMSLVINARDAMPKGGHLTIQTANVGLSPAEVSSYPRFLPGNYVLIEVTDTGTGMTPEIKAHIFEPFFTTKPVGQGTGLGLPTCLGIVQQHEGQIMVESQVDQGTTFKIYLPASEKHTLPDKEEPSYFPRGSETILLVEDEVQVRELIARVLRRQGYTVIEAGNGEEALQVVAAQPELKPHLLLSDVVMPRLGGKALMAHLKQQYPDLKVLFISGYANEVLEEQEDIPTLKAALLAKPFAPVKLAQSVRAVLDTSMEKTF